MALQVNSIQLAVHSEGYCRRAISSPVIFSHSPSPVKAMSHSVQLFVQEAQSGFLGRRVLLRSHTLARPLMPSCATSSPRRSRPSVIRPNAAANPGISFPSFPLRFPGSKNKTSPSKPPSKPADLRREGEASPAQKSSFRSVPVSGKSKGESDLDRDRPLPLPMTYPDSTPLGAEAVEEMLSCDPDVLDCKNVVYQWTDKCRRCYGTGLVSYQRKRKNDVTVTCVACTGIGYVNRFTVRDDIPVMGDIEKFDKQEPKW